MRKKTMQKLPFLGAPLLAAIGLVVAAPANAVMVDININISEMDTVAEAQNALSDYTASKRRSITEDFEDEDFEAWDGSESTATSDPLSTAVGDFEGTNGDGDGSACVSDCDNIQVADEDSEGLGDSGRTNTTEGDESKNWLDSNDIEGMVWTVDAEGVGGQFTDLAFFLSDVADVGATLNVDFSNGGSADATIEPKQDDGTINFVTARFSDFATDASVEMLNSGWASQKDGLGVDDVTVAVPAPATLALLGLGLLGLAGMRRVRGGEAA